jgi:hypothetical protein
MNSDRDFERTTSEWLNTGSDWTPPHVIDAVLLAVRNTPQERGFRIPWRTPNMKPLAQVAAGLALLAVAGIAGFYLFAPRANVGTGPGPSPTARTTQAPSPTLTRQPSPATSARPTPDATPVAPPIDTTAWARYESERYGFSVGYPADWRVAPSDHDWTMANDADDWLSSGAEAFYGPNIRVSVWSVPVEPTMEQTPAALEAWVQQYCEASGNTPCTGILDRSVELCVEVRDCHPGLLVHFQDDVQAFFRGGTAGNDMTVIAVWWGEAAPAVAPYGGSQRLLEAFLSTMNVALKTPRDAALPTG